MLYILGLIVFIVILVLSPTVRCAVFNPIKTVKNAVADIYKYFKYKKWNEAPFGKVIGYIADSGKKMGCGKTLTAAQYLTTMYQQYDGKMVWCAERKKWVTQKILILSNVTLKKVPFLEFVSFQQWTNLLEITYKKDREEDTKTVIYAFIDEASCLLNSRDFKTNMNAPMIQSILCCRHYASSIYMTSQKAKLIDALMRSVCSDYIGCDKLWRFMRINHYIPDEIEYATDPTAVKPYQKECWFIENKHFENYNTYELLRTIEKKYKNNDFMTEEEILTHLQMPEPNAEGVLNPSRKYKKSRKKLR